MFIEYFIKNRNEVNLGINSMRNIPHKANNVGSKHVYSSAISLLYSI